MSKYKEFLQYYKKVKEYERVAALIEWDLQTQVPDTGVDGLVNCMGTISAKKFELETSEKMGELLKELLEPCEYEKLEEYQKTVVEKAKKYYDRDKNVPVDFYKKYSILTAKAGDVWQRAKRADDYKQFEPYLKQVIEMTKQLAEYQSNGREVYEVLLDNNEEGMSGEIIDCLFEEIKQELIPLVKKITEKKQELKSEIEPDFSGNYDIYRQKEFSRYLLEYIGFSFDSGVMAESEHPFTTALSNKDVRLTDHYIENDIIDAIFSIIHEGGHGIFEQHVSDKFDETPLFSCRYLGLHESQSRFFENILGHNINFWKPIYGKLQKTFPNFKEIPLEAFYRKINEVQPSLIRTSSDEVTYCFHIIIRYEIEKEIFSGKLELLDIPKRWNEKMKEYLGITPEKDSEGALQDTHWSGGAFGYFPSYLLGSIYDGMFLEKIEEELGCIDDILAKGEIKKITHWLNENIHQYGSSREPKEVLQKICGKEISAKPLIRYFKKKYESIYFL